MLKLDNGSTLTDNDLWQLKQALAAAQAPSTPQPPVVTPPTQPPVVPSNVRIIPLPWTHISGQPNVTIAAGQTVAFAITPPVGYSSNGQLLNISISPTNDYAYFLRDVCLSDTPGDFSGKLAPAAIMHSNEAAAAFFTVGGYPKDRYGRPVLQNANLNAGQTYYYNIRQQDPSLSCKVNYGLAV